MRVFGFFWENLASADKTDGAPAKTPAAIARENNDRRHFVWDDPSRTVQIRPTFRDDLPPSQTWRPSSMIMGVTELGRAVHIWCELPRNMRVNTEEVAIKALRLIFAQDPEFEDAVLSVMFVDHLARLGAGLTATS